MRGQGDVGELRGLYRIDDGEAAIAVTGQHLAVARVDAHIVRIVAQVQYPARGEIVAAIEPHRAVAAVRDDKEVGPREIGDALRLIQAADAPDGLLLRQIDDIERVVADLRDEETLAVKIDR